MVKAMKDGRTLLCWRICVVGVYVLVDTDMCWWINVMVDKH